jgi:hypothetical protein
MFFNQLPVGTYVIRATLTRMGGKTFVQEAVVDVHGSKIRR